MTTTTGHWLDRRGFLRAGAAALGAAALPATLRARARDTDPFGGFKVGAQSYTFRNFDTERALMKQLDEHLGRPRACYYFTDRPGLNRLDGRLELVHDNWLYPVFESLRLAEPRSAWLGAGCAPGHPACRAYRWQGSSRAR